MAALPCQPPHPVAQQTLAQKRVGSASSASSEDGAWSRGEGTPPPLDGLEDRLQSLQAAMQGGAVQASVMSACAVNRRAFLAEERAAALQPVPKLLPGFPPGFEFGGCPARCA